MNKKNLVKIFIQHQSEALKEAKLIKKQFFEKRKVRVLGVSGSMRQVNDCPHESSTSEWLLNKSLNEAEKLGAETKLLILRDHNIQPCKSCYSTTNTQCHYKCTCYPEGEYGDDMTNKIYDIVMWADIIIFATPVNNFKISSHMSLFIDRLISMDGSLKPADENYAKNKPVNIEHTKWIQKNATSEYGSGFLRRFTGKTAGIIVTGHEVGASMTISSLFMTLNHFGMIFPPFSNMYAINTVCEGTYKDKGILRTKCYEEEARMLARNLLTSAKIARQTDDYWWEYDERAN